MKTNTKKLTLAGVLCAVAVVGSMFSFPVFGSKCAPVQHMVNILCAVLLGPMVWCCSRFYCQPAAQSAWSWQPDGFSRQHVRCLVMRSGL